MLSMCRIKISSLEHLRLNSVPLERANLSRTYLTLHLINHFPRNSLVLWVVVIDYGSILRTTIIALLILCCWVVEREEMLHQIFIFDFARVESDV